MDVIFHIAEMAHWDAARHDGAYTQSTRGRTLEEEGFIHCSYADQVDDVAENFYADVTTPLVLLTIDTALVCPTIQVDNGFPHIYGPLNTSAVIDAVPFDA